MLSKTFRNRVSFTLATCATAGILIACGEQPSFVITSASPLMTAHMAADGDGVQRDQEEAYASDSDAIAVLVTDETISESSAMHELDDDLASDVLSSSSQSASSQPATSPFAEADNSIDNASDNPLDGSDFSDFADKFTCSRQLGISMEKIIVSGNKKTVNLVAGGALLVRVAGNQARVNINAGSSEVSIAGICLFLSGNNPKVILNVEGVVVDGVIVRERGNQPSVHIELKGDAQLGALIADLSGKGSALFVNGAGALCESMEIVSRGNHPLVQCH